MKYYGLNGNNITMCSHGRKDQIDAGVLLSSVDNPTNEEQNMFILERLLSSKSPSGLQDNNPIQGQLYEGALNIQVFCGIKNGVATDTLIGINSVGLKPVFPGDYQYLLTSDSLITGYDTVQEIGSVTVKIPTDVSSETYVIPIFLRSNNMYLKIKKTNSGAEYSIVSNPDPLPADLGIVQDFIVNTSLPSANYVRIVNLRDETIPQLSQKVDELEDQVNKVNGSLQSYYISR